MATENDLSYLENELFDLTKNCMRKGKAKKFGLV